MKINKVQRHRHLPAFILLQLAQGGSAHGGAIYHGLLENIPEFQCDTAAVYRTLGQLEAEKAVTFCWDTTHSGPARKVYSITEEGFVQLDFWAEDMKERLVKLRYFLQEYEHVRK